MRIKLINPPIFEILYKRQVLVLPYGLSVLASFLRKNRFSVEIFDSDAVLRSTYSEYGSRSIMREISRFCREQIYAGRYKGISSQKDVLLADTLLDMIDIRDCDILGIGIPTKIHILPALLLIERIKNKYNIPVVIGGAYVTAFADLFFKTYDFIDYAIVGEGEIPLLKFAYSINGKEQLVDVPSLWYRNNFKILFNGRTNYNIENQSCPDFDGLPLELYTSNNITGGKSLKIPYSLSRGCTNKCSFCDWATIDGPWQYKSIDKVIKDIKFLKKKYKSNHFHFEDSNFNVSHKYVSDICDQFIQQGLNIKWYTRVRPFNLDKDLIFKMKRAGCVMLFWGIESGSNRVLQLMKKGSSIDNQIAILKMAKEAGIVNSIYLILRYPYETTNDLEKTALLIKNNKDIIDRAIIYGLEVHRGSYLFNKTEEVGIKLKEFKISFFSYTYNYEETSRTLSRKYRKALTKLRRKIIMYNNKYIMFKFAQFPQNVIMKYVGICLPDHIVSLIRRKLFIMEYIYNKLYTLHDKKYGKTIY